VRSFASPIEGAVDSQGRQGRDEEIANHQRIGDVEKARLLQEKESLRCTQHVKIRQT
jgi:hypothetical protein